MAMSVLAMAVVCATASGCGSGAQGHSSLAALCSHARTATEAIFRKRVSQVIRHGLAEASPASAALARGVAAAAEETLAADLAADAEVRELAKTAATRAALATLATNEAKLRALSAHSGDRPITRAFDLAEASGGCRRARPAIGG